VNQPNPNPATLSPRQIQQCAEHMAEQGRWEASIALSLLIRGRQIVAEEERRELQTGLASAQLWDIDQTEGAAAPRSQ